MDHETYYAKRQAVRVVQVVSVVKAKLGLAHPCMAEAGPLALDTAGKMAALQLVLVARVDRTDFDQVAYLLW